MKKFLLFLGLICATLSALHFITKSVWAEESTEISEDIPELYIRAVNPGYTVDKKSNVGELIEIGRKNSDTPFSLAGATVGYTNSSGNYSILFEFPENSWITGETILLRLASSPDSELAAATYTKTIAMKAELTLEIDGEIIDEVCFTSKNGCYKEFKSTAPTTLVRNLETGEFEHLENYEPTFDKTSYFLEPLPEEPSNTIPNQCQGIIFSEILSYYESTKSEQFIELHNTKSHDIPLDGCRLRYKNKLYHLSGVVKPEEYFVYYPTVFILTKNPTSSNKLELIDVNNQVVAELVYPNGQKKGTSYALIGYDQNGKPIWKITYAPTPGQPNNYQEFRSCAEGKVLNQATGNCVKATSIKDKVCKAGYYLNPATNRCRKIKTTPEKTCKEGYYLNPETNRCRKIKENNGTNYDLKPENYQESSSFIALYAILGVAGLGLIYLIYEFRHEIAKFFGKVFRRFRP